MSRAAYCAWFWYALSGIEDAVVIICLLFYRRVDTGMKVKL